MRDKRMEARWEETTAEREATEDNPEKMETNSEIVSPQGSTGRSPRKESQ
jgi:hypothetical protein